MGYPQLCMYPYPVLKRDVHPPTHPTLDGLMSAPKGTWRIQFFFWGGAASFTSGYNDL